MGNGDSCSWNFVQMGVQGTEGWRKLYITVEGQLRSTCLIYRISNIGGRKRLVEVILLPGDKA